MADFRFQTYFSPATGNAGRWPTKKVRMMFSLFKKKQKRDSDPYLILQNAIELLPEFYRREPGFSDCVQQSANRDSRAIESLIALTKIEGHYFSDEYWKDLLECAQSLNLPLQASYCNQ